MCRRMVQLFLFVVLFAAIYSSAYANAFSTLPPGKKPVIVETGLYLDHLVSIDEATEVMRFNATLTLRWQDKRLAFDKQAVGVNRKDYDTHHSVALLSKIWHPQIDLVGASSPRDVHMMNISITPDGVLTWTEEFGVSTSIIMELRQFPFDNQMIEVSLRPFIQGFSSVRLVVLKSHNGVAHDAHLQGWKVLDTDAFVKTVPNAVHKTPTSQYTLLIQYKRLSLYYIYQLLVPVVLIVFLSLSVLWMLKNPTVNLVAISLTAVLTIIVFQWRIQNKLPRVSYHTFVDFFMLISFLITASTVLASLILGCIKDKKRKARLAKVLRIAYPLLYLFILLTLFFIYY